ncbi:MAG: ATP-binding cassette domain-containing protein [Acholeplasmataceae bacterium]|jgi:iron complex transport system ATP-binding protein|nr:ATP-binding cassette domain-containing protein [Acholeplasmataceae bacterium]
MIEIKNIYQAYGDFKVLDNVSLTLQEHKITALIGANGAGKSTLLGVLSRLLSPSEGDILVDGTPIHQMKSKEIAKKIAILKQTHQLHIRITVRDLVSFGRFPHSQGRLTKTDQEKIDEVLEYMSIQDLENRYLDELSGGQRQRAYIAMILAQDTKYIFLDEPLNNLDMRYAVEMMTILQKMVKELNKTIVVVMHDINFAAAFADHIIAMKDGKIIVEGSTDDMMDKKILDHIFDHDFCIAGVNGRKVCIYYNNQEHMKIEEIKGEILS